MRAGALLDDRHREYRIDGRGLTIGDPLDGFQGVLRGVPVYVGEGKPLLEEQVQ
jgi:circadian clock protein KaiC